MQPVEFVGADQMLIGDIGVRYGFPFPEERDLDEVVVMKPRSMIEQYLALFAQIEPRRLVEFGIQRGGSTAMMAALTRPEHHLAFELSADPIEPLARFLAEHGLDEAVHTFYGVDQADTATIERTLGPEPLDLVVDDASHRYVPTLASFECLYPRLRPGGAYVIEDWAGFHQIGRTLIASVAQTDFAKRQAAADALVSAVEQLVDPTDRSATAEDLAVALEDFRSHPDHERLMALSRARTMHLGSPSLSRSAMQLTLACAETPEVFASVRVTDAWIEVRRSGLELDPATFRVADAAPDLAGMLGTTPVAP